MGKKRVLITGVSGLLGGELAQRWKNTFDILGVYNTHAVQIDGIELAQADLLDTKALADVFKRFKPQVVVHCAALADIDTCQGDPQKAHQLNVAATANVAALAAAGKAKLAHISTDAVFDGRKGKYREEDPVNPVNVYGQTKLEAEAQALKTPGALVIRTAFYGFNIQPKTCFAEALPGLLAAGKTVNGFKDVMTSAIYTGDLADVLAQAIAKDLSGIYHAGAADPVSKYELACVMARGLGFDPALIKPVSVEGHGFKAPRGKDLSLNTSKLASALGKSMVTMAASAKRFVEDYERLLSKS